MLVDSSVGIDHLRRGNKLPALLLENGEFETHPFVVGELACANLQRRDAILSLLTCLPAVTEAEHDEVLSLVESKRLAGRGLGWAMPNCWPRRCCNERSSGRWTSGWPGRRGSWVSRSTRRIDLQGSLI